MLVCETEFLAFPSAYPRHDECGRFLAAVSVDSHCSTDLGFARHFHDSTNLSLSSGDISFIRDGLFSFRAFRLSITYNSYATHTIPIAAKIFRITRVSLLTSILLSSKSASSEAD